MFKMKFSELSAFDFQQTVAKIAHTTTNGHKAYEIKKLVSEIKAAQKDMRDLYKETMKKYAETDPKTGEVIIDNDNPESGFKFKEGVDMEAFKKERNEFGENEAKFFARPWTLDVLSDVKLAAADLEHLGPCFSEKEIEKPEHPQKMSLV